MESLLGNTRRPDISFYADGRIDITSRVARSLGLCDGDVVDIVKHEKEVYLYVKWRGSDVIGKHEAQCRATKPHASCTNFRAFSVRLCKAILDICKAENVARLAAGDKVTLEGIGSAIPLITRINLQQ